MILFPPALTCPTCHGAREHLYSSHPDQKPFLLTCWTCEGRGRCRDWHPFVISAANLIAAVVSVTVLVLSAALLLGVPVLPAGDLATVLGLQPK
ncbi:hypothetical protein AB0F17_34710 [Nonomuraea sp. NPDC026600]|uniref:hypothetical protein n=1 Tax=Nonomuraea sp. NPDC026600 TaxID=3155363 RepID=UPI00340B0D8C